jgi:hypothetical protein
MKDPLETTVQILRAKAFGLEFISLARLLIDEAEIDEASAKASILRLNFEGRIRIDPDWVVSLDPVECRVVEECEAFPQEEVPQYEAA